MGEAKQKAAAAVQVHKVHLTDAERLQVFVAISQKPADSYEDRCRHRSMLRAIDAFEPTVMVENGQEFIVLGRDRNVNETRVFELSDEVVGQLIDALQGKHQGVRKFTLVEVEDRLRDVKRGAYALPPELVVPSAEG